jgi:hypothetical protein
MDNVLHRPDGMSINSPSRGDLRLDAELLGRHRGQVYQGRPID